MNKVYRTLAISGVSFSLFTVLNLGSRARAAGVVHPHCATVGYNAVQQTFQDPNISNDTITLAYIVDSSPTPPDFLPPPPPFKECRYEISDVTAVSIKIVFKTLSSGSWTLEIPSGSAANEPRTFENNQNQGFRLAPHQNMSADPKFEFNALDGLDDVLNIKFSNPNPVVQAITQIQISASGTHYYLGVRTPEPTSTLGLLALGTLGATSTLKRQLKPSKSTEKETTKVG